MRLGSTVVTVTALYLYIKDSHRSLSEPPLIHLVDTTYALAFFQIAITTGLIAYRTWSQEVSSKKVRTPSKHDDQRSRLMSAVVVVIESGMFYTVVSCLAIVSYTTRSDARFILREAIIPSAGECLESTNGKFILKTPPDVHTLIFGRNRARPFDDTECSTCRGLK